jgi:thiamine-monophosphate kinase
VTAGDPSGLSGEDRLIAQHFRPLARHPGALGLGDDAAYFTPPAGCDLVLTVDAVVGGVHFFPDDPPDAVARKALRVNLSDLAAKGARPAGFLLALALPDGIDDPWLRAFAQGLGQDAETYGCALMGGDTVRSPGPLMVSVTAFGTLPGGSMVHRAGASVGDLLFVSGSIGDAALGLVLRREPERAAAWPLTEPQRDHLRARYLLPQPRCALAEAVRTHASAAMDVSDGLVGDLAKLCRESGVSAALDAQRIPASEAADAVLAADAGMLTPVLTGGDDYEILCAVPERRALAFARAAAAAGVAVAEIGRIVAGDAPPAIFTSDGEPLEFASGSYSHF